MKKIREFASGWGDNYPLAWSERIEEDLVDTAKGHLFMPMFRPFDFLEAPNKPLTFLSASSNRIAVEALRGTQKQFHRNVDFDELFFQWAGETRYETEFGLFESKPGEMLLMPSGVAHRASGSVNCLRLSVRLRDPLDVLIDERGHIGHTEYAVTWEGGPDWPVPKDRELAQKGRVDESVHTWDDVPGEETLIERTYDRLIGVSSEGRPVQPLRLFDIFNGVTGEAGLPGPVSFKNNSFLVECYNTKGAQGAFHRGNRNEEFQFQFFGTAENICEFGADHMTPGDLFVVRRGIGHRVIGSPDFRRIVIYSAEPWKLKIDPAKPLRRSRFKVQERVVEAAAWRKGA